MFHRIIHEHWTHVVPIIAFVLTFLVFVTATVRALRMKKPQRVHLAALPLDQRTPKIHRHHGRR